MGNIIETTVPAALILIQALWWIFLVVIGIAIINCAANDKKTQSKPIEPSYKSNPAYKPEEDDLWIL